MSIFVRLIEIKIIVSVFDVLVALAWGSQECSLIICGIYSICPKSLGFNNTVKCSQKT